jgi:DNA-binding beta-propeller fold protein YncE
LPVPPLRSACPRLISGVRAPRDVAAGAQHRRRKGRSCVHVTGEGSGGGFATVAYDAAPGSQLWTTSYPGSFAQPHGIAVSPDGTKVYVTDQRIDGAPTQAYDASDGHGLGGNIYKSAIANGLAVSPDGTRLYVTGQNGQGNGITIAYNAVESP